MKMSILLFRVGVLVCDGWVGGEIRSWPVTTSPGFKLNNRLIKLIHNQRDQDAGSWMENDR